MPSNHPSIAVVVLDTLRKDAFDEYFDWLHGRRFENAWSPSHWTTPVHAWMHTGRYSNETGVYADRQQFDCEYTSLAEDLQAAEYQTRYLSCNVNVTPYFGFDRRFDEFENYGSHT